MQAAALYRSSIGKKAVMAITGAIWIGYVIAHMYGNLKAFEGSEYFNAYAEGLRELGHPVLGHLHFLTIARIVLLAAIVLHVWSALSLTRQARRARPSKYAVTSRVQANFSSLTMRWGGIAILLFLLYHLAQLTWGLPFIKTDFIRGDAYYNMVSSFQSPFVVAIYLAALVALALHLYHGTWSMFQTLGINNREYDGTLHAFALAVAILVSVGFAVVPISVMLGVIS